MDEGKINKSYNNDPENLSRQKKQKQSTKQEHRTNHQHISYAQHKESHQEEIGVLISHLKKGTRRFRLRKTQ